MDHNAGVLDEFRWSNYFNDAYQAATATQGGALLGRCLYNGGGGDGKDVDDAVQFLDVHSLSNWRMGAPRRSLPQPAGARPRVGGW
ncbi:Os07g0111201 [Oryza sativa Japonica Group]|uniref:Uncharacterized protein n=3 Tax=Oryza sativa TaxID=4530 RepID=A0A8J8YNE6_ORYSJ|nr:hypothetical protein OsI_24640 [Oryza sativa Indica Group]EEE66453.1 hypothetical protein OsJ_22841 [Oryza sativa Japonica Group]BAS99759.1 Os07g0111201 [Oryza sativa Japonica Group]